MSNFDYLQKLNVTGDRIVDYTFYNIGGEPTFQVRPATESNKPYFNAMLKRSRKMARVIASGNINAAHLDQNRDNDRDLFPKHVIVGWKNVVDNEGNPVEFTQENATDYLSKLPNWILDDLRNFVATPTNFAETEVDVGELAKNS